MEERELKIKSNNIITSNPLPTHLLKHWLGRNVNISQLLLRFMAFNGYLKDMLWRLLLEHKTKNYSERLSIGNTSEFPSEPLDFESPIFLLTRNPCECDIVRNI